MIKSTPNRLGDSIRISRKEIGLSQKMFANSLAVSDKTVSSYEVGRIKPSFETIKRISRLVNKPISYFDEVDEQYEFNLKKKIESIEKELLEIKKIIQKKNL